MWVWEPWVRSLVGPVAWVQGPPQVEQEGQQFLQLVEDREGPRQELGVGVAGVGKEVG